MAEPRKQVVLRNNPVGLPQGVRCPRFSLGLILRQMSATGWAHRNFPNKLPSVEAEFRQTVQKLAFATLDNPA